MKLVQLVLLCSCLMAGGVRADIIPVGSKSENLSPASITLDKEWLNKAAQNSGSAQVKEWNLSGENQNGGCGFLCLEINTSSPQKAPYMRGLVNIGDAEEKVVSVDNGKSVKIKATLSDLSVHGVIYVNGQQKVNQYITGLKNGSSKSVDSGYQVSCLENGCSYQWKAGLSGGTVALSISIPDLVGAQSFTIPSTTIATVISDLYSENASAGITNEVVFRYTAEIKLPALTITLPERCYTQLSGSMITFKSDIDASTVTADGGPAVDSRSVTLNATCNTVLLNKSIYASVKLVQQSGVDDGYKFKLNPKKNEYNLNRYLSVVAKHVSEGAAGGTNCGKDTNTFDNGKLYNVGQVAFPGRPEQSVRDPYNITFNLCAFRPEGSSDLLPPGEYTGAIRVITRFYTADK
ncbi:TPA: hypothetical protein JZF58_004860 [Escherichia coli]|nr:hypothetical protein [Escherichia coli]